MEYIIQPDITVMVHQVNSKNYTVAGEVNYPGRFPLLLPTRAFDAINEAGGFKDFANKTDITIMRSSQRLKFNYEDFRKEKNSIRISSCRMVTPSTYAEGKESRGSCK